MRKRQISKMTALLLVAALCAGCGSGGDNRAASDGTAQTEADNGQEGTAVDTAESTKADGGKTAAGENAYAAYQGYAYAEADGQVKYALDATDGLRLYCYFQSDSPAYEEVIYDLTLAGEGASTDVTKVVQEPDTDLTDSFAGFHFAFYPQQVVMTVERKEEKLAGGESENLLTGEYTLAPSDWKPQQTGEKADGRSTGAAEAGAETADFMAPYQSRELVALARAFYQREHDFLAPEGACTDNGDGTTTIRLYENVQIDADTWHTATSAWYTVDAYGRGRDDVMETEVTLPGLSLAELAAYMGTPETLTYVQEAEGRNEWKITDGETIAACLKALEQMKVGEKTDLRAADAGDTLLFTMADGSTWTLDFENGNLVRNGSCYATEGWKAVREVLKEALAGEGMQ